MTDKRMCISGLIVPTFTPFDKLGELHLEIIPDYAEYLISKEVTGIFICGTTGEGLLLSVEERCQILEAWMPFNDRLIIISHVSCTSYVDSIKLASHAQDVGVDAISCMGPCYFPPNKVTQLVEFNSLIARSASRTPYYYYHIPGMSRVNVSMFDFLGALKMKIPTFAGVKFTSKDLVDLQECVFLEDGRFDILNGNDEYFLSGLIAGVKGSIGTSFNFIPELYLEIEEAYNNGDIETAKKLQMRSIEFVKLMLKYENGVVCSKAMFKIMGLDLGPCRLPLGNLHTHEYENLEMELERIGKYASIA